VPLHVHSRPLLLLAPGLPPLTLFASFHAAKLATQQTLHANHTTVSSADIATHTLPLKSTNHEKEAHIDFKRCSVLRLRLRFLRHLSHLSSKPAHSSTPDSLDVLGCVSAPLEVAQSSFSRKPHDVTGALATENFLRQNEQIKLNASSLERARKNTTNLHFSCSFVTPPDVPQVFQALNLALRNAHTKARLQSCGNFVFVSSLHQPQHVRPPAFPGTKARLQPAGHPVPQVFFAHSSS
jgi:hypothetical protein